MVWFKAILQLAPKFGNYFAKFFLAKIAAFKHVLACAATLLFALVQNDFPHCTERNNASKKILLALFQL